jgi:hypothetical protein
MYMFTKRYIVMRCYQQQLENSLLPRTRQSGIHLEAVAADGNFSREGPQKKGSYPGVYVPKVHA